MKRSVIFGLLFVWIVFVFGCGEGKPKGTTTGMTTTITKVKAPVAKKIVKNTKFGLTVNKRKKIYYDLANLQDKGTSNQYMEDCYKTISKKYNIKLDVLRSIAVEGAKSNWPLPKM